MDTIDPYSTVRAVLDKFPTDEDAKNLIDRRDILAQRIHIDIIAVVEQLNNLKPYYSGQIDANVAETERLLVTLNALEKDIERRKLCLKEKEIELEDLQQLSEVQRGTIDEQKKQLELVKIAEMKNGENWTKGAVNSD
uniref:Uncharacterized protein n=1 Tax=Setaria digitata TaxID=48799 RepID=A0A915PHC8_9BILA